MEKKIDIESSRLKQMRGKVLGVNNTTESIHIDANGPLILKLLDHFSGNGEHQKARGQPFDITHYPVIHPALSSHILFLIAQGGYHTLQEALVIATVPYRYA